MTLTLTLFRDEGSRDLLQDTEGESSTGKSGSQTMKGSVGFRRYVVGKWVVLRGKRRYEESNDEL